MGLYDTLSKLDTTPVDVASKDQTPVEVSPAVTPAPKRPKVTSGEPGGKTEVKESSRHDVVTDVMTPVLPEDVTGWRKTLAVSETHNSALRLSAQERDDIEDCVLLLRRTLGIKTSMNELARLGLLLLVHDVRERKRKSLVCAVKQL